MSKWWGFSCALIVMMVLAAGAGIVRAETEPVEIIEITVSPNTLFLDSAGVWVSVHTNIPYSAVETLSLQLNGIDVAWTKSDAQGQLVAKFNLDEVKSIVAPPSAELTLSGTTRDGVGFMGTDTIKVIASTKR